MSESGGPMSTDHPSLERLDAYRTAVLPEADAGRIQDHLVACEECTRLLLDMEVFPDLEPGDAGRLTDADVQRAWRSFRAKLDPSAGEGPAATPARATGKALFGWPVGSVVAAGLLIVSLALGVGLAVAWRDNLRLRDRLRGLSLPQPNALVVSLEPPGFLRSAGEVDREIRLPSDAGALVLLLAVDDPAGPRRLALDLLDERGRVLWSAEEVEKDSLDNVRIVLSREFLPPGRYEIRLYRADQGRASIGAYGFRIAG